jgi:hypothetical protein
MRHSQPVTPSSLVWPVVGGAWAPVRPLNFPVHAIASIACNADDGLVAFSL